MENKILIVGMGGCGRSGMTSSKLIEMLKNNEEIIVQEPYEKAKLGRKEPIMIGDFIKEIKTEDFMLVENEGPLELLGFLKKGTHFSDDKKDNYNHSKRKKINHYN